MHMQSIIFIKKGIYSKQIISDKDAVFYTRNFHFHDTSKYTTILHSYRNNQG